MTGSELRVYHPGSVKQVLASRLPTAEGFGEGVLDFGMSGDEHHNAYSVGDYGMMPDRIPGKSRMLHRMTNHFFRLLEHEGIPNHYIGDLGNRRVRVKIAERITEYSQIRPGMEYFFIPIEVVVSNILTPIASAHGRLRRGVDNPTEYGLPEGHVPGDNEIVILPESVITLSTKIEAEDVYRDEEVMMELAGINEDELARMKGIALGVNRAIAEDARIKGFALADGKLEFAMGRRGELYVVDTCYTWDENRILYDDVDFSKQTARNYYRLIGWWDKLKKAQKELPQSEWPEPPNMHPGFLELTAATIATLCERITRKKWDGDVKPGEPHQIAEEIEGWYDRLYEEHGISLVT